MFGRKKTLVFDDFDTDFDSGSDTCDDNNVTEFRFVVEQHRSDAFDEKTSGDEWSAVGDNTAGISTGAILIFFIGNSTIAI